MTDLDKLERKQQAMEAVRQAEAELRSWDPIGVIVGEGLPMDEYDSYAPHIVSLLAAGASAKELAAHLQHIRTGRIGLSADPARIRNALRKSSGGGASCMNQAHKVLDQRFNNRVNAAVRRARYAVR